MSAYAERFDQDVAKVLDSVNENTPGRLTVIPLVVTGLTLLGLLVVAVAHVADAINECDVSLDRLQNRLNADPPIG